MDLFVNLQKVVPQKLITALAGCLASVTWPPLKNFLISRFVSAYDVDMSEARALSITQYSSFNDFFTRELKPGARPIHGQKNSVACPADGRVSEAGRISSGQLLQAKGINYSVERLLADSDLAESLDGGFFATVYLSPKDYHRVHMPVAGKPESIKYIPGSLFSVNQRTAENIDSLFARNERLVATFTNGGHRFAVVLVGAMIVGGMETVLTGPISRGSDVADLQFNPIGLEKGDELGRFYLGSTAIVLLPKEMSAKLRADLHSGSAIRMGEELAQCG